MYNKDLNRCFILFTILDVPLNKNNIFRKLHYVMNLVCPLSITFLTIYMLYIERPFNIEYLGEAASALTMFPHVCKILIILTFNCKLLNSFLIFFLRECLIPSD